jgi:hypothetical protein
MNVGVGMTSLQCQMWDRILVARLCTGMYLLAYHLPLVGAPGTPCPDNDEWDIGALEGRYIIVFDPMIFFVVVKLPSRTLS